MNKMTLASCQYPIEFLESWSDFESKINHLVEEAADKGADLLLFPEYGSVELASLFGPDVYQDLHKQLSALQTRLDDYLQLHCRLAQKHGVYIAASTFPVLDDEGTYRNRAFLFGPDGRHDYQDKHIMTRFENEHWDITGSVDTKVFDTAFGRIGFITCYDAEFPLLARQLVEAGVNLLLVPCCTDTDAGYYRVRLSCQARAIENQCYVAQSPTVGESHWSMAVDQNIGRAGIFSPCDHGFPDDGVMALGEPHHRGWIYAELDLERIHRIRHEGRVLNYRDWDQQHAIVADPVITVHL